MNTEFLKVIAGVIAERSRASKTLAVEQEVPSSNPGMGWQTKLKKMMNGKKV